MDNHTPEQKRNSIVETYGEYIKGTKVYDNSVIMIKFTHRDNNKVMWLKRMITENYDLEVKQSTAGGMYNGIVYWFE